MNACDFCGRTEHEVSVLVNSPAAHVPLPPPLESGEEKRSAFICLDCIIACLTAAVQHQAAQNARYRQTLDTMAAFIPETNGPPGIQIVRPSGDEE